MLSNNWLKVLRNRLASGSCLPQRRRRGKTGTKVQPLEQRSLLAATILYDDFESGAMNVAKWDYVDAVVYSSGPIGQSGTYATGLDGLHEEFNSVPFNLSSYITANLSFSVQAGGNFNLPEVGDDLIVLHRLAGGGWSRLATISVSDVSSTSFQTRNVALPTSALHSAWELAFTAYGSDTTTGFFGGTSGADDWFIDDVIVTANRRPVVTAHAPTGPILAGSTRPLTWSAADPDGDSLSVTATVSKNGKVVHTSTSSTGSFSVSTDGVYVISVSASDGSASASTSDSVTIDDDLTAGTLDTTFDTDGIVTTPMSTLNDEAWAVAVQADGKTVAAGPVYTAAGTEFGIARYNVDGSLDTSFDLDGKVSVQINQFSCMPYTVAMQADGKIVVAGWTYNGSNIDFAMARLLPNGGLDTSFGTGGKVITPVGSGDDNANKVVIQPDGKILLGGETMMGGQRDSAILRYEANGSLDTTFATGGIFTRGLFGSTPDGVSGLALQPDGKIVASGFIPTSGTVWPSLLRLNTNGTLDGTLNGDGFTFHSFGSTAVYSQNVSVLADGDILVGGVAFSGGRNNFAAIRYNDNGSLDSSFDGDGLLVSAISPYADSASQIFARPDGKFYLGGTSYNGTNSDFAVARYNSHGTLDSTFGTNGVTTTAIGSGDDIVSAMAVGPDGRIVLAGGSYNGTDFDFTVARYLVSNFPTSLLISSTQVVEGSPVATAVGTFSTVDPDAGETFTYSLVSGAGSTDNASFTIDGNTLKTTASFDFETKSSYSLRVRTTDQGGLWFEKDFTITVSDVAEDVTAPVSLISALPANSTSTTISIAVTGSDSGAGASGVKEYDLYYSTGGAFIKFATVPAASPTTTFTGNANTNYWFRSLGRDNAGNVETKTTSDTYTRIGDVVPPSSQVNSAVPTSAGLFTVAMSGTKLSGSAMTVFDVYVAIDSDAPMLIGSAAAVATGGGSFTGQTLFQGLPDGTSHTYRFFSVARDASGNVEAMPSATADVSVTIAFSASGLTATGIDVQNGVNQRSYLRYLDVLFSTNSGVSNLLNPSRVKVERFGIDDTSVVPGTGTLVMGVGLTQTGNRLRLDFGATGLGGLRQAGNGFYRILLNMDGNDSFADASDSVFEFHRLFGDANGDAKVDVADTNLVTSQIGRTGANLDGDLDGNGSVNSTDRLYTTQQRGKKLLDPLLEWLDD